MPCTPARLFSLIGSSSRAGPPPLAALRAAPPPRRGRGGGAGGRGRLRARLRRAGGRDEPAGRLLRDADGLAELGVELSLGDNAAGLAHRVCDAAIDSRRCRALPGGDDLQLVLVVEVVLVEVEAVVRRCGGERGRRLDRIAPSADKRLNRRGPLVAAPARGPAEHAP